MSQFHKIRNDIGIIKAMKLDCETAMISEYLKSFDMSAALAEKTRYEELQKKLAEQQKAKETAQDVTPSRPAIECASELVPPVQVTLDTQDTKTIKVIFYDTTAAFRTDMKALTEKTRYKNTEGIK